MKKFLVISAFALTLFGVSKAVAQNSIEIGVKGGLSIPNLTSGSTSNPLSKGYGSRLDADVAVHTEFQFSNRFSIQPQLEYSSQGGKKNGTQAFTVPDNMKGMFPPNLAPDYLYANYKSEAIINYLMLPILAKYRFMPEKKWGAYIAAGLFVSLLLSAKNVTSGSSVIYLDEQQTQPLSQQANSFDNTENVKSDLHAFNTGISGHIGFDYKLPKSSIFIEGGGNYGFVNIQKDERNGKNKTGSAVLHLGYQFRL